MSQKQLWAPWRMEYLSDHKSSSERGCVFCVLPQQTSDRENLIVHRAKHSFVIMNRYPYNNGHLMVVPNRHVAQLELLPDEELSEIMLMAKRSVKVLESAYQAEGFNLGMNVGQAGGAGIKDHLHLHIVPRWIGDTNFMPVVAETKSMPQHLLTSYDQIFEQFRRL